MIQNTRCAAFWVHTNVRSGNKVYPCCRYKTAVSKFDGSLDEILQSPEYEKLRQDSESGISNPNCAKCFYEESLGGKSLRQIFNEQYAAQQCASLRYLEIGFDNMCNLACDGCGPEFSSTWATLLGLSIKSSVTSIDDIEHVPDSLEKIVFLGGEPLINNRHKKFLSKITNLPSLEVVYNTNGSFLLDSATIESLYQCRSVKFILSIDGVAELNTKVRKHSDWQKILKFIDQITLLNFELEIHTVLHRRNWFGLPDLQRFVKERSLPWSINVLTYPPELDIIHLPDDEKIMLRRHLQDLEISSDFIHGHLTSQRNTHTEGT